MTLSMPAFVKNDQDLMRWFKRTQQRDIRYPNWRQVYYDCNGICQYPVSNEGELCGELDTLEFHEIYDSEGKVIQIALVCLYHHQSIHDGICNPRHFPSKLQIDIDIEMRLCSSLENWKAKYQITERSIVYDFTNDNGKYPLDLQFSENSENNGR